MSTSAVPIATIIVAALGLLTTLLAPLIGSMLSHRQSRQVRLRELRMALYLDLAEYVEKSSRRLEAVIDESDSHPTLKNLEVAHPVRLAARVNLLATPRLKDAWAAFEEADRTVAWEWQENPDSNAYGQPFIDPNSTVVQPMRNAIGAVQKELMLAIQNPDSGG